MNWCPNCENENCFCSTPPSASNDVHKKDFIKIFNLWIVQIYINDSWRIMTDPSFYDVVHCYTSRQKAREAIKDYKADLHNCKFRIIKISGEEFFKLEKEQYA